MFSIPLDDLIVIVSDSINRIISFLKNITFTFMGINFDFWTLLIVFFVLEMLIWILLRRGGNND